VDETRATVQRIRLQSALECGARGRVCEPAIGSVSARRSAARSTTSRLAGRTTGARACGTPHGQPTRNQSGGRTAPTPLPSRARPAHLPTACAAAVGRRPCAWCREGRLDAELAPPADGAVTATDPPDRGRPMPTGERGDRAGRSATSASLVHRMPVRKWPSRSSFPRIGTVPAPRRRTIDLGRCRRGVCTRRHQQHNDPRLTVQS